LDSTAAAPYEAAWCRSNRESIQNQRSERHRSQHSVLLRVLERPKDLPPLKHLQNWPKFDPGELR
jgi:hypothetical protein